MYTQIVRVAEVHEITINIEPHGYYTTKPVMAEMLAFADSPFPRMNMDTARCQRFIRTTPRGSLW